MTVPGESVSDYRLMFHVESRLAVKFAKRIRKVQKGNPEELISGAYLAIAAVWTLFFAVTGLIFVAADVWIHSNLISEIFGPLSGIGFICAILRYAQSRSELRIIKD